MIGIGHRLGGHRGIDNQDVVRGYELGHRCKIDVEPKADVGQQSRGRSGRQGDAVEEIADGLRQRPVGDVRRTHTGVQFEQFTGEVSRGAEPTRREGELPSAGQQARLATEVLKQPADGHTIFGTNHYQFITALPVLDLIAAGKLRALAVTAPTRMPVLKDVPSVVEEGFPQLVIEEWVGLVVKSGTPDPIIARLNEATNKALAKPSVREAFAKIAAEPAGGSPAEFGAFLKSQIAHWGRVMKDAGIKIRE